jgi:hypothetical protein
MIGCSVVEASFLSGSSTGAQNFTAPASDISSGGYWTVWGTNSMNFLATSSIVTLQFKDLAVGTSPTAGADLGLDNVSVTDFAATATPLPAALPLFATGLGALGLLGWRRKRKAKTA